ncbi:TetR family transcriptional regulator [Nocardia bovistercoris]|uniref:TetR family transcriptional regulator n=1 Tax=Nocardia bovistercoris TaxID=2785916 RepID=A0A931IFD7_9NOCA|nr:TetR family transcriptional regulator [Nocardia bovistercoris]MBH0780504.1 TetR family transcriptional regulator [Nocardia bovistercoris]
MTTARREEILTAARELFLRRGYAATSIADIAAAARASKAVVLYHFKTKDSIVAELLDAPSTAVSGLIERAEREQLSPARILTDYIDGAAETGALFIAFAGDPSVAGLIPQHDTDAACRRIIELLAGPAPTRATLVRARAAFAVAQTVLSALQEDSLDDTVRAEIRSAALRALGSGR